MTTMRTARAVTIAVSVSVLSFIAVSTIHPSTASAQAAKKDDHVEELALAIGETKTIPAAGVKNFSEGVPGIVDVRLTPAGDQFIIAGKKTGNTTLLLIKNDGTQLTWMISVSTKSPAAVERELQQLIEGMNGVRIRRVGPRFFLEGGVTTEAELKRVQQVAQLFPGQVESLVTLGSGGAADRKLLIRLDFFFVQYDRTSSYAVGLGWPDAILGKDAAGQGQVLQTQFQYDFISKTTTAAQASIVNQPLPRLDIASRHGWAKVLKQSTVITSNGSEATFNSGGEQNFLNSTGLQTTIVKIAFGTNVTVLPRFDSVSKEIEIKLDADVSDLVAPQSGTIPGRVVTLKLGQALILSGIRTRAENHSVTGLPGLSSVPILGILFGSHSDQQNEIEGAVFIIPSIIETVPKSAIEVIKNALSSYEDYSGDIDKVDSYNKTPPAAK
jgi:pilus assembly protein CpaC